MIASLCIYLPKHILETFILFAYIVSKKKRKDFPDTFYLDLGSKWCSNFVIQIRSFIELRSVVVKKKVTNLFLPVLIYWLTY